jgi:hypothetical protein
VERPGDVPGFSAFGQKLEDFAFPRRQERKR